jgi:outer membrane protein assembly factor BamB
LWIAHTGGFIFSSPAVAGGAVYVGSGDHKLYSFTGPA